MAPVKLNFFRAMGRAFSYGFYVVYKIIWLLGQLLTGGIKFSESAGGPITIISTMSEATRAGFGPLAYVVGLLSANLAIMNLLPFPALDGARMLFVTIEWIRGKPINKRLKRPYIWEASYCFCFCHICRLVTAFHSVLIKEHMKNGIRKKYPHRRKQPHNHNP